jgi:TfoX/Sxy family transcriptional regulator of competence genes
MPYNEEIEAGIQSLISNCWNTERKRMFGGICHLIHGNMFCGVYKEFLIVRLGEEAAKAALRDPFVRPFDITGKPMKGWVMVEEDGWREPSDLLRWLELGRAYALTLPKKARKC